MKYYHEHNESQHKRPRLSRPQPNQAESIWIDVRYKARKCKQTHRLSFIDRWINTVHSHMECRQACIYALLLNFWNVTKVLLPKHSVIMQLEKFFCYWEMLKVARHSLWDVTILKFPAKVANAIWGEECDQNSKSTANVHAKRFSKNHQTNTN